MTRLWLDANVLLRFIVREPLDQWRRSHALMRRAELGAVELLLTPLAIAEVVWILGSQYGYKRPEIRDVLRGFLTSAGLSGPLDQMVESLDLMADRNVAFEDAMLAIQARDAAEAVCTFDKDFRRLPAEVVAP